MSHETCERIRARIALGEEAINTETDDHLRSCRECRVEASRIARLTNALARTAAMRVPARLDSTVLALISEHVNAPESILRPRLAIALALVALIAGILAIAGWSGGADEASTNPLKVVVWVWVYLALAAVAALPMLVHHAVPREGCLEGMKK
jgi:hypothetical protein